jgi:hypothetical protein
VKNSVGGAFASCRAIVVFDGKSSRFIAVAHAPMHLDAFPKLSRRVYVAEAFHEETHSHFSRKHASATRTRAHTTHTHSWMFTHMRLRSFEHLVHESGRKMWHYVHV